MGSRSKRFTSAIALLLVFSTTQLYVGVSFAGGPTASGGTETREPMPQQVTGILTTQGNNPITVNGASAVSGATMLSGASIETPSGVSATVNLGSRGSLQIDSNTKLTLDFDQTNIRVMLIEGCVTLRTRKGTTGEIDTPQGGVIGKTDPAKDGKLEVCPRRGAAAIPAAATGGLFGIGTAATLGLIGGITLITLPIILGGRVASPST
jgi:hypothetical protein